MNRAGARPGIIECTRLRADVTAAGPAQRPFGAALRVYDLDVVSLGGDDLAFLLVSDVGATVAVVTVTAGAFAVTLQVSNPRSGLSFPTASVNGKHLEIAMMSDYGKNTAQILTGRIPIADLK
jgi:hypothetical protein